MALFEKSLMRWREPKIKGFLTGNNVLVLIAAILVVSVPFGFLSGGRFSPSIWLQALGFLFAGSLGLFVQPLLPGQQIELGEDAIVRRMPRRNRRSAYEEIECCYYTRSCSYLMSGNNVVIEVDSSRPGQAKFTDFEVMLKEPTNRVKGFPLATVLKVNRFAVPEGVDLDSILQILRERNVRVEELTKTERARQLAEV